MKSVMNLTVKALKGNFPYLRSLKCIYKYIYKNKQTSECLYYYANDVCSVSTDEGALIPGTGFIFL